MMRRFPTPVLLRQLLVVVVLTAVQTSSSAAAAAEEEPCAGGSCPMPADSSDEPQCSLWLGPSPIKQHEEHGFGLGAFTGRDIKKGETIEGLDGGELIIPFFDSKLHNPGHHPPLLEYMWNEENMPEIPLESRHGTFLFLPGLAGICPFTSENYNVEMTFQTTNPPQKYEEDNTGVHRSRDPTAGSFAYRHKFTYTAVRDIVAGEELTVECSNNDFDGGAYYLARFHSDDHAVTCLDNLRVDTSTIPGAGRGIFAKQPISKYAVITSTPLVPIHKDELYMVNGDPFKNNQNGGRPSKQLLLNYCFGHPNSDLLLLPYGHLANFVNHAPKAANAVIRWHQSDDNRSDQLPRRQQYHHPELLELPADVVAAEHGKGLMMDIVALRDISPNEEILIDYGPEWAEVWKAHVKSWKTEDENYISASDYIRTNDVTAIRTAAEQESDPYPSNLQTACMFDSDAEGTDKDEYTSWNSVTDGPHECLRPCIIMDRDENTYKAKILPIDNSELWNELYCRLRHDYGMVKDIPRTAIRIIDRPYTSDQFLPQAFRHHIGVPDDFFPETWMKKKVRQRTQSSEDADSFKRKNPEKQKNVKKMGKTEID